MHETGSDPESLAREYLDALEHGGDTERQAELEDRLSDLQHRREKFVNEHGEDSGIVQRVDEKIDEVETELDALKQSVQRADELREKLLKSAVETFEFNTTWLSPTVLNGLTHALYGQKEDFLILDQTRIENTDTFDSIDDLTRLDMEHTLLLLIEDQLGQTSTVKEHWERLVESKSYTPFLVVTQEGTVSPDDVLPELDKEDDRKDAKNWLEKPIYTWEQLVPYYRPESGRFALSTAGKYIAYHYAGDLNEEIDRGAVDSTGWSDDNEQASLGDINN